jgi:hypothetical protein
MKEKYMNKKVVIPFIILVPAILLFATIIDSCRHDTILIEEPAGSDSIIYFNTQVLPIFINNCTATGCHGIDGNRRLKLTSYSEIMKEVSPGNPNSSQVYTAITSVYGNVMPPNKPLDINQRTIIRLWIMQGAKNNVAPDTSKKTAADTTKLTDTTAVSFNKQIFPIIQANCALSCHYAGSATDPFSTYEGMMKDVIAGKPNQSMLYLRMTGLSGSKMPPGGTLTPNQLTLIRLWISQGAKKSLGPADTVTTPIVTPVTPVVNLGYACFTRDIWPIINSNCAMCHTANSDISLQSYSDIMLLVKSGNPLSSRLYTILSTGENQMPPYPKQQLSQANRDSIYSWILRGATNETCVSACDTTNFKFASHVYPIITTNCTGCHNSSLASGGVVLTNYATIQPYAVNGKLVGSITHAAGYKPMPQSGSLSTCDITVIEKWVNAGSSNN